VTGTRTDALALAGRLVQYPGPTYAEDLSAFVRLSFALGLESTSELQAFVGRVGGRSLEHLQEMFTQTFDMTPACALEVGWHLFGDDYARGAFLAQMREALRAEDIPEGSELPDHLASMLSLVARLDPEQAEVLVTKAIVPAVDKMLQNLEKIDSPFHPALTAIREVLMAGAS
jgi:nitrate reductase delta subunit